MSAPENDAVPSTASCSGAGVSALVSLGGGTDEPAIRARLRGWIVAHAKVDAPGELGDQTPLLETGLLSSLDIVELVLFLEELRGAEIDTDAIEPDAFVSVDAIWEGFFAR
jgi:acyl carrier protein